MEQNFGLDADVWKGEERRVETDERYALANISVLLILNSKQNLHNPYLSHTHKGGKLEFVL